jgi:hypothetical protein
MYKCVKNTAILSIVVTVIYARDLSCISRWDQILNSLQYVLVLKNPRMANMQVFKNAVWSEDVLLFYLLALFGRLT